MKTHLTKSERYIAFLKTELPKLSSAAIYSLDDKILSRAEPLFAALEVASSRSGAFLEFGVYKGGSIRACATKYPDRQFVGFDSFEGFPADNRVDWKQDFSVVSLPNVPGNATLIKGWFKDTLPLYLERHGSPVAMVNIDCDIYSSTVDIFQTLIARGLFQPGLVISFDELLNYRNYLWNEMLALFEALETTGLGIKWIACHRQVRLIDETIELLRRRTYPAWDADIESGYRQQASLVLTDRPPDYSNLFLPHFRENVRRLAREFDSLSAARLAQSSR